MSEGTWTISPCPHRQAASLARELGLSEITASVLVRRGYGDPDEARAFLAGEQPLHDPFLLGDMKTAVERIRTAIASGRRICVHGDYDADGICATALAVLVLREAGANVDCHLPSRFDEGYGVNGETLARLAEEGCGLVLTVDCGITAVEEAARANELGLDIIVTDHHRPGEELPACPIVATRPSDYPFPELCGTAVVYKLGQALLGPEAPALRRHLDLVALATIADVVPLVGENRSLAIAGLRGLARTRKPGLQALMGIARVDPAAVDAGAVGFRLAPRIHAAVLQVEEWPDAKRRRLAYVLWGEDWHEGVIGIVASRLVERYHRPVVLIAGTDGLWKGSGRSIPSFDLHAALGACARHLERFGGHRAAAGLSILPERVEAFAYAVADEAESSLAPDELVPATVVDAVLPRGTKLTLELCQELRRLAPFGLGNPEGTLLAPACEVVEPATVGDGRHRRFRVRREGFDAGGAIAFGLGPQLDRYRRVGSYDVAFRLQENHWNGTVAPQLVVRRIFDADDRFEELYAWLRDQWSATRRAPVAEAIFAELGVEAGGVRRHPLESETFRALLVKPALLRAA